MEAGTPCIALCSFNLSAQWGKQELFVLKTIFKGVLKSLSFNLSPPLFNTVLAYSTLSFFLHIQLLASGKNITQLSFLFQHESRELNTVTL